MTVGAERDILSHDARKARLTPQIGGRFFDVLLADIYCCGGEALLSPADRVEDRQIADVREPGSAGHRGGLCEIEPPALPLAWCGRVLRIVFAAFEIFLRNCQVGSWARQGGNEFSILGRAENNEIVKIKVSVGRVIINIQGDL